MLHLGGLVYSQRLQLQDAAIFWSPRTGAHEVQGAIFDKWTSLGRENGFLGMPLTDETPTPDGVGRYNDFEGGSIYWHPDVGAHEVHGAIRERWTVLGRTSSIGYPITDEADSLRGRFSNFAILPPGTPPTEGATSIYWSPATGAHWLGGDVLTAWRNLGSERSFLGYPTSDYLGVGPVRFERGTMHSTGGGLPTIDADQRIIDTGQINIDGVAANGSAKLMMNSAGQWNYSGKVRATGALSYDFAIATALIFADGSGTGRAFSTKGDVEGTLTIGGNRDHPWDDWGNDNWISEHWDNIVSCLSRTELTVEFNESNLLGHIGSIIGIPLLVIGAIAAGAWFGENYDSCGGYDSSGNRIVTAVPRGRDCPPGMTKLPRERDNSSAGPMPGDTPEDYRG
jgi:hypothetical protein